MLGPVYAESFGPDIYAIFIADPKICHKLLSKEGPYPQHAVPHSWRVYNARFAVDRGLFFLDGSEWWRLRKKMNPLLMKTEAVHEIAKWGHPLTQQLISEWKQLSGLQGIEIPKMSLRLHRWSVETMLAGLYGDFYYTDAIKELIDIPRLICNVQTMFEASTRLQTVSSEEAAETKSPEWITFQTAADEALKSVHDLTKATIGKSSTGLVSLMRLTGFDNDEISRLASDFIIAAADTTSYTIQWCLYLLSCHQQQEKARAEALKQTSDDLDTSKELTYIRWCNKEAMRLYPVAPFITRILSEPLDIEGYSLPAGQLILLSTFAMGRDEKYFPYPETFWPERWERLSPTSLCGVSRDASYATLPFGHGIRSCIGKRLAEHQVNMTMRLIGLPDKPIRIKIKPMDDKF